MSNNIEGTVKSIGEREIFPSGFSKRQLVITTVGDYPQTLPIYFLKEKADLLDDIPLGTRVKVAFDIRGAEGKTPGKYFVDLTGWKIDKV